MLLIYYTLESLFKREYKKKRTEEFKKGYLECLRLLDIGMQRNPSFNAQVENKRLLKEIEELQRLDRAQKKFIRLLEEKVSEKSISSRPAIQTFRVYQVEAKEGTAFSIVANLSQETFLNMCSNFAARFTWDNLEDAKAKMLNYINSKSAQGYKAYKDEKSAFKEGVKIKRT